MQLASCWPDVFLESNVQAVGICQNATKSGWLQSRPRGSCYWARCPVDIDGIYCCLLIDSWGGSWPWTQRPIRSLKPSSPWRSLPYGCFLWNRFQVKGEGKEGWNLNDSCMFQWTDMVGPNPRQRCAVCDAIQVLGITLISAKESCDVLWSCVKSGLTF